MEDGINLLSYYRVLRKRWKILIAVIFLFTVFGAVVGLMRKNIYYSEALVLPLENESGDRLSGLLASGAGILPFMPGMVSGKTTKLSTLMQTRTLCERLVKRLDLKKVFYKGLWDEKENRWKELDPQKQPTTESAVKRLQKMLRVHDLQSKAALLVAVESEDPKLAAFLANEVLVELKKLIDENAFTRAEKDRIFIGEQLAIASMKYLEAGKELGEYYQKHKISSVLTQIDVDVASSIIDESGSPNRLLASNESDSKNLSDSLMSQKQNTNTLLKPVSLVKDVPQNVYLQYLTVERERLGQLKLFFAQQYEMAKINEAKDKLSFQILDDARVPLKPAKPNRILIILVCFLVGCPFALFIVFLLEYVERMKKTS